MAVADAFPRLFAPLTLGPVELPGRIVSTAHQTGLVERHLPTGALAAYHAERARGGAALIVLEATAVHPSGLLTPHTLGGYLPEIVDGYRRLAQAVRPHGARLGVQLFHGGREQIASPPRAPALAPSAVPSPRFRVEPRALRPAEIEELIAGYALAARHAAAGGLDAVEVSAAHRYLIEQFLDPSLNRRTDAWAEGAAFLRAVLRAVREAAPGLALGVRVSADSPAAAAIAAIAEAEGAHFLSAALGESSSYLGSAMIVPPPPVAEDAIADRARALPHTLPLIATSRVVDVAAAERLLATGVADAVGMTRALIADPELPAKARTGREAEIVRCIGCNVCIAHYHAGTPIACAVSPRSGRELELPRAAAAARRLRVAVVGAGPAGLAAAAEAGALGHEVVVLERAERPGGQMALALAAPGGSGIARGLLDRFRAVDVRLGVQATAAVVAGLDPDAVVLCSGARPYEPPLALDSAGVDAVQAWDVLAGARIAGRRVVVADWGGDPSGLDAAELLATRGHDVTLAIASAAAGEGVHQYRRNLYLQRLYRAGATILHHVELRRAGPGEVVLGNVFAPELETALPADVLVLALGRVPADGLRAELDALRLPVEEAGDCLGPRSLEEAILEGTLAARRLA
ncbi:MAG TPA: FAD-dependent oxidoreductase [Gaiellaceae bacterium]|nr:FAD-dependent oxidoreductase [Gaiellaceae bacterium]